MTIPSCSDVTLSNAAKPDGNSYAYCLAAEIRALKAKNLTAREISEGGTGAITAQDAIANLTGAASATVGQVLTKDATGVVWSTPATGGEGGGGDVTGPASSVNANIAIFDGLTGKVIADSGVALPAWGELVSTYDTQTIINKTYYGNWQGSPIDISHGGVPGVGAVPEGYVLTKVGGVPAWQVITGAGLGDVSGPTSAVDGAMAVFNGTTGKIIKKGIEASQIVDTFSAQTLANKTLTGPTLTPGSRWMVSHGGTGMTEYAVGDLLYSHITNGLAALPIGAEGEVLTVVSGKPDWASAGGAGLGDVSGPAIAVADNFATYNGTTGKLIKDSGKAAPLGTIVGTSDTQTLSNKTLGSGCVWNGNDVAIADGGTGASTAQLAINNLTNVAAATAGHVLTKVGTNVAWAAAAGGSSWPYYAAQSAVGSNITYYSGQTGVAVYPHNDYQSVIRVIRGASDYTGTPTTYSHLGQLNGHTVAYQTYAGYQQYLNTDGGGRTMSNAYHARVEHNTYGDTNGFFTTVSNNGHGNMAGISGNWTGQPSVTCFGGEAYANAAKTNLYAMEVHLNSNGQANVTGIGTVIGLNRDNTTAIYNHAWIGHRVQSEGTQYADTAFQAWGNLKFGLDLTGMVHDANKAGIIMATGSRIYMGASATTWPTIVPTASGAYLETDNTRIKSSVGLAGTGFLEILSPTTSSSATAGVASPLPANPFTYITIKLDGVSYKIPAYSA